MKLLSLLRKGALAGPGACTTRSAVAERTGTDTDPPVNATRIFHGEINRAGKPTGFRARPRGTKPDSARVVRIPQAPNRTGVCTAQAETAVRGWLEFIEA